MSEHSMYQQYSTRPLELQTSSGDFLSNFNDKYPTELDCTEALIQLAEPETGFSCRACNRKLHRNYGQRMVRCRCSTRNFLLADSPFRNVRRPDAWWGYFCSLMKRRHFSTNGFAKLFKTSPSTSHNIFGVCATVLRNEMKAKNGVSTIEFIDIYIKRSRETEARKHPNSEELCMHSTSNEEPPEIETPVEKPLPYDLTREETIVMDLISSQPVQSNAIYDLARMPSVSVSVTLSMLELKGYIQRLPGDRWIRVGPQIVEKKTAAKTKKALSSVSPLVVDGFFTFVRDPHHGCSRKYVQNYLTMFWFFVSKRRWSPAALIATFKRSPPISGKQVFNDVTPPLVRVCIRVTQLPEGQKEMRSAI